MLLSYQPYDLEVSTMRSVCWTPNGAATRMYLRVALHADRPEPDIYWQAGHASMHYREANLSGMERGQRRDNIYIYMYMCIDACI
jgi:hypothetical protein